MDAEISCYIPIKNPQYIPFTVGSLPTPRRTPWPEVIDNLDMLLDEARPRYGRFFFWVKHGKTNHFKGKILGMIYIYIYKVGIDPSNVFLYIPSIFPLRYIFIVG